MITFFTSPRAFEGEFDKLQRTAIQSWMTAVPRSEIILFGRAPGVREFAEEMGTRRGVYWSPNLATNEHGTPLFSDMFRQAEVWQKSTFPYHDMLCEISADIVLGGNFGMALDAIQAVPQPFMVGRRYDVDPHHWGNGPTRYELHAPCGIDYFVYRRGTLGDIPPFAVGCTAYDQWLLWAAMERWNLTVIDATEAITAVHINHGYPAWAGGKSEMMAGQERAENHRLARETGCSRWAQIDEAPWVLRRGQLVRREFGR